MDLAEPSLWKHADDHHGDGHPDRHGQYVGDGSRSGHLFRSGVHWTIGAGRFNHLAHSRHHHRDGSRDDTTTSSALNHASAATVNDAAPTAAGYHASAAPVNDAAPASADWVIDAFAQGVSGRTVAHRGEGEHGHWRV